MDEGKSNLSAAFYLEWLNLKLQCSAVQQDQLLFFSFCVNLSLGHDINCCLKNLLFPLVGCEMDNRKQDTKTCWQSWVNEKWNSSRCTKTSNTHTDKRNRCKHTGKYQTLTAFRSHVRLRAPRVLTTIGWHMLLVLYWVLSCYSSSFISALVCGESNKDFGLWMSLTTVVVFLFHTDWRVFLQIHSPGRNIATSKCGVYKTQAG